MSKEIIFSIFVGIILGIFLFIRRQKKLKHAYIREIRNKYQHIQFNNNNDANDNNTDAKEEEHHQIAQCPRLHSLKRFSTTHGGYICDLCNKKISLYQEIWGCRTCNYDVCSNCHNNKGPDALFNPKSLETVQLRAEFSESFAILDTVRDLIIRDFINDWYKKGISSDDKFINHIKFAIDGIFQILVKRISSTNWAYFIRNKVFPPLYECLTLYTDIVNDFRKNNPKWDQLTESERDNLISEAICSGTYQWHRGCESNKASLNCLRKWSLRVLEQVLDDTNFNCQPVRIFCREILTNNIFLPIINLVDGYNVNYSILSAFIYLDTMNTSDDIIEMEENKENNKEISNVVNDSIFEPIIKNNINNILTKKRNLFGNKKKEDFHHDIDDIGFLSFNKQIDERCKMLKLLSTHRPTKNLTIRICHVSHDFDSKHNPYVVYVLHIRDEIINGNKNNSQRIEWTLTTRFSKLHAFYRAIQKDKILKQKNIKIAAEFPGKAIFPQLHERKKQLIAYFNTLRRYPGVLLCDIMYQLVIPPALIHKYQCVNEEKSDEDTSNQYEIPKALHNNNINNSDKSERISIEHYEHLTPSLIKLIEAILNLEKRSTFGSSLTSVATSIGSLFFNGYIAHKLYDKSGSWSMDGMLSYFTEWIKDKIWIPPTNEMNHETIKQPCSDDIFKLKMEARQCVEKIFELYIGNNKIAKVIGKQQLESCTIKFWRFIQQNVLLKHLAFTIIDSLLKDLFHEKISKRYQRKREKKQQMNMIKISSSQTSVQCPKLHRLKKFSTTDRVYNYICESCNKKMSLYQEMWGCRVCNYDLCSNCHNNKSGTLTNYNMDIKLKSTEDIIRKSVSPKQRMRDVKRNDKKPIKLQYMNKSKSRGLLMNNAPNISLFSGGSFLSDYTKQFIKIGEKNDSSDESLNEENENEYSTGTDEAFIDNQNRNKTHGITDKINNFLREKINKYASKAETENIMVYGSDTGNKSNKPQTSNDNSSGDNNNHNNNNNNNNSKHNRNGFNGGSGSDDDGKNNENNKQIHTNNNMDVSEQDEKEIDRFFDVLRNIQTMDDSKLYEILSTFSSLSNVFEKVSNGIIELNSAIQRVSLVSSISTLPVVKSPMNCSSTDTTMDDNGYSTKSDSIENEVCNNKFVKKRKRRRRKPNKQNINKRYEYKYSIQAKSDIEHEQKIKQHILKKKWYDKQTIRYAYIYGDDKPNGRITYSIEISEFMRRCQKFVNKLKNNDEQFQLIPICMFDNNSCCVDTQYLFIIKIDDSENVNIAVSFKYNADELKIEVTGFHLKPKCECLASQMDLSGFKIGYLNIYGQTIKQYENRYYKLIPFIRDFRKTEMNKFVLKDWKEKAEHLWKDVIGTV